MSKGESFVAALPLKARFHDAHERRAYLRAMEIAKRIIDDPNLIAVGARYLDQFMRDDPHQAEACRIWRGVLAQPPEQIARALLEDSVSGAELRNTAPVFVTLSAETLRQIWTPSR